VASGGGDLPSAHVLVLSTSRKGWSVVRAVARRLLGLGVPRRRLGVVGGSRVYRSAAWRPVLAGPPLWPWQVRSRRFSRVGLGRRGVDPAEVAVFLDRVAGDLARAYAEVASLREQNERIKAALRDWQSRQAPTARELAGYR